MDKLLIKNRKLLFIVVLCVLLIFSININSIAANEIDTSVYKNIYEGGTPSQIINIGNEIIGIIQTVGVGIAVIMLLVIGIKYIMASANERANLKGQLIIYVIGAVLLFAGTTIFSIIAQSANDLDGGTEGGAIPQNRIEVAIDKIITNKG